MIITYSNDNVKILIPNVKSSLKYKCQKRFDIRNWTFGFDLTLGI